MVEMARDAKQARDTDGVTDEVRDAQLARYEAGDFNVYDADGNVEVRYWVSGEVPMDEQPQQRRSNGGNQATGRGRANLASAKQVEFINSLADKLPATAETQPLRDAADKARALTSREASELIDELKAAAPKPTATAKQVAFFESLTAERVPEAERAGWLDWFRKLSPREASDAIDTMKQRAKLAPAKSGRKAAEAGLYSFEGTIVKVQENRAHTGVYAKRLNTETGEYELARGLQFKVTDKLTLAEATKIYQANHALSGQCLACGRELTDEYSMEVGIGPICRNGM